MRLPLVSRLVPLAALLVCSTPSQAAWPISPYTPNLLPSSATPQDACSDGAGGVFVVTRSFAGNTQIRVYRIGPDGNPAGGWPASGVVIADYSGDRDRAKALADGAGGVFVTWQDGRVGATMNDIYVQRVTASGGISSGWPTGGVRATSNSQDETFPQIAPDGYGGVFLAWGLTFSSTDFDIYAARVSGAGGLFWSVGVETSTGYEVAPQIAYIPTADVLAIAYGYKPNTPATYDIKLTYLDQGAGVPVRRNVCLAASDQYIYQLVAGTSGYFYILWRDGRTANYTVYAACYQNFGQVLSGWPFGDGLPVANAATYQASVLGAVDPMNALWVAIADQRIAGNDVVVQRMFTNGLRPPEWPASGNLVSTAPLDQVPIGIGIDGAQNAVIAWTDYRNGSSTEPDMYATRVRPDGSIAPGFAYQGQPLALNTGAQQSPGFLVPDAAGGAFVGWQDGATALQHIDRFGALGDVAPHLTSVRDVHGDQGGSVRLQWSASPYDAEPIASIGAYWVWRSTPAARAAKAVARGARWLRDDVIADVAPRPGALFMADPFGATAYAWEYLASLPASLLPAYSYVAATTADSTGGGNPYTAFMVQARSVTSGPFWSSPPDSGYSVDDLAPAAPAPFGGLYAAGSAALTWGAPPDPDVVGYRLHRGTTSSFTPSLATLVASPAGTSWVDVVGAPFWYKVAAVDAHGNIGPYATALPTGALGAPGEALPTALALELAGANPSRGPIALRLALPHATHVRVAIYDVRGRRVRTLVDADEPAGRHEATWDGRDAAGTPVADGLYFARMDAEGRHLERRVTRLR